MTEPVVVCILNFNTPYRHCYHLLETDRLSSASTQGHATGVDYYQCCHCGVRQSLTWFTEPDKRHGVWSNSYVKKYNEPNRAEHVLKDVNQ